MSIFAFAINVSSNRILYQVDEITTGNIILSLLNAILMWVFVFIPVYFFALILSVIVNKLRSNNSSKEQEN